MASATAARPDGARRASPAVGAARDDRPADLTEEEARAAQLEAAIVAEERQAEAASRKAKAQSAVEPVSAVDVLEVSAAEEYAYVARDVRRIAIVGGSLVGLLLIIWVDRDIAGIGSL